MEHLAAIDRDNDTSCTPTHTQARAHSVYVIKLLHRRDADRLLRRVTVTDGNKTNECS